MTVGEGDNVTDIEQGGQAGGSGDEQVTATLSKSNAVSAAVRDTLIAHLGEFMSLPAGFGAHSFHEQSGITNMKAAHAPAVWIDDKGADDREVGAPPQWQSMGEYSFDIEIWDKADGTEAARVRMNVWRDAVQACLNGYWHLGCETRALDCNATKGDPAVLDGGGVGSDQLWMSMVRATVTVMSATGSATL
jgi:hypothetical protein